MLFTPEKKSAEYYWFGMVILRASAVLFAIAAILSFILPRDDVSGDRKLTAAASVLIAVVAGLLSKAFSNMMNYAIELASEREFLVVYDYGMGGAWAFATAGSETQIKEVFPELAIVAETPAWMTPEEEQRIRMSNSFVVSDPTTYPEWIKAMAREHRS